MALIDERCRILDTLILARNKHPGQSNSLDALCRRYQIDNSRRDLHGALIDAKLLGEVYLAMTGRQDQLFANDDLVKPAFITEDSAFAGAIRTQRLPLPVIQPTNEELNNHREFLQLLTKTGRCIWKD